MLCVGCESLRASNSFSLDLSSIKLNAIRIKIYSSGNFINQQHLIISPHGDGVRHCLNIDAAFAGGCFAVLMDDNKEQQFSERKKAFDITMRAMALSNL